MNSEPDRLRDFSLLSRPAGPRGTVAAPAPAIASYAALLARYQQFLTSGNAKYSDVILLSEYGGSEGITALKTFLDRNDCTGPETTLAAVSALAVIGGPVAVETLLELAVYPAHRLSMAALSSLEFLCLGRTTPLTEPLEAPVIDTPELRDAYKNLSDSIAKVHSSVTNSFVKQRLGELLKLVNSALG